MTMAVSRSGDPSNAMVTGQWRFFIEDMRADAGLRDT
jgi:hypothetical protein